MRPAALEHLVTVRPDRQLNTMADLSYQGYFNLIFSCGFSLFELTQVSSIGWGDSALEAKIKEALENSDGNNG